MSKNIKWNTNGFFRSCLSTFDWHFQMLRGTSDRKSMLGEHEVDRVQQEAGTCRRKRPKKWIFLSCLIAGRTGCLLRQTLRHTICASGPFIMALTIIASIKDWTFQFVSQFSISSLLRGVHHSLPGDAVGGGDALAPPRARPWAEAEGWSRQGLV